MLITQGSLLEFDLIFVSYPKYLFYAIINYITKYYQLNYFAISLVYPIQFGFWLIYLNKFTNSIFYLFDYKSHII